MDRRLFEMRIFPAIDIAQTGTRKEEMLLTEEEYAKITLLRRALSDMSDRDVIPSLIQQIEKHDTNREFLDSLPG